MRLKIAIACISASIIAFQLCLMQILSHTQWYHFAFMIISIALMGFGIAGTFLSLFRKKLISNFDLLVPLLLISAGIAMIVVVPVAQLNPVRFDSFLIFTGFRYILKFILTCLLYTIPFFLGSLAIGMVFVKKADQIGTLYFFNLAGSAIGGVLIPVLLWFVFPRFLPVITGIISIAGGLLLFRRDQKPIVYFTTIIALIIMIIFIVRPVEYKVSQFKNISKTLDFPDAEIILEKTSPYGLIQVVRSSAIRYAPGLSLAYREEIPDMDAVYLNGNWYGPVIHDKIFDSISLWKYTTKSVQYILEDRNNVLILNTGSGEDIHQALHEGSSDIMGVEPNGAIISLFQHELAESSDSLFYKNNVTITHIEPRTFIQSETSKYDLIILPTIGVFGGTSGIDALKEQYLFTLESIDAIFNRLNDEGVLSIGSWMDYPSRNPLKILITLTEVLGKNNIENYASHIVAIRSWGTITFMLKKTPFSSKESENIRNFCSEFLFDPALLPDITKEEQAYYNQLQDDEFFRYLDLIMSGNKQELVQDYLFNIDYTTDDKPFFSQFLKSGSFKYLKKTFGISALAFFEIGYFLLFLVLLVNTILSIFLIILPLSKVGWSGSGKLWILLYFSGIGIGYMFIEIVLIQWMILYFGNPIYSAAIVMSCLLLFSGLGSLTTQKRNSLFKHIRWIPVIIISLLVVNIILIKYVLVNSIDQSLVIKGFIIAVLIGPMAYFMGMLFPLGIRMIRKNESSIPWAWGINSCLSVVGSILALAIAIQSGFTWVMIFAAIAYILPVIGSIKLFNR